MRCALRDAKLNADQIGYINAHGTSTPQGDIQEAQAVMACFGSYATRGLLVSSTKSCMGHLLGGAGAVEAAISALAIFEGILPPTLHLDDPDPAVNGLDLIPKTAREKRVDFALSNSFGFGGTNASLVLGRI
jgi:3-oxoacyl-[acyl-carrier-protein] synthase II